MINGRSKANTFQTSNSNLLTVLKWLVYIILAIMILFLLSSPLRAKLAKDYISKGDELLAEKKYLSAQLEYQKALSLKKGNKAALDRIELAKDGEKNILTLEPFYEEQNNAKQIDLIKQATEVPKTEKEGVLLAKQLIEKGEYQLAAIPVKTVLEMDSSYQDAQTYLAIANIKTAELTELSPENKQYYLEESKSVAKGLDQTNEVAKIILTGNKL